MSELKPCPFCGSHNVKMFYDERQNYHVECYGCNKTVSFHIVKESSWRKAVATWNRRAQPAEPLTRDYVEEAPAADVSQVVHGRWTDSYKSGYRPQNGNICSVCDCWAERRSNFCPNCGAKCDQGEENGQK